MGQRAFETYTADRDPTPGKTVLSLLESMCATARGRTVG